MLAGCLPFDERGVAALLRKIAVADYEMPPWISQNAASLLRSILVPDPSRRCELCYQHADGTAIEACAPPVQQSRHGMPNGVPVGNAAEGATCCFVVAGPWRAHLTLACTSKMFGCLFWFAGPQSRM